jgi:hypothetical protein
VGVDLCHSGSAGKGEVISHSLRNGPEARGTLISVIKARVEMLDCPDRCSGEPGNCWTALARSGYLIHDLANPCQPTAYLCPKAEDGNRRKSVPQRARQRSG